MHESDFESEKSKGKAPNSRKNADGPVKNKQNAEMKRKNNFVTEKQPSLR